MGIKVQFTGSSSKIDVGLKQQKSQSEIDSSGAVFLKGKDGATFTPEVSQEGVLSWTNDKGLDNPGSVNIKGPTGPAGPPGDKGDKGDSGRDGKDGLNGKDGISPTHYWQGSTLYVTSASGTSSANLKGEPGEQGPQGIQGIQGIKGETGAQGQKGADGTPATHRWSGTTLYISSASGTSSANLKGDKGDTGAAGKDGYTPIKGVDYFDGKDGAPGADGADGQPGKDGAPGKDGQDGAPGVSGVYVGSGDMPEGYNVQIDPNEGATGTVTVEATLSDGTVKTFLLYGCEVV